MAHKFNLPDSLLDAVRKIHEDNLPKDVTTDPEQLDEAKKKGVSWVPRDVAAKFAKQKKEKKMFASAKREINRQKKKEMKEEVVSESWSGMSHEAKELVLHGDNDFHLHSSSGTPVMKNLEKKFKKGTYNHEKAKDLWAYHADRCAKSYCQQHGSHDDKWHQMFSTKVRKEAAQHWCDRHYDDMKTGN
jgi:hypothetical protein